jgi:hypothetical protein
MQLFVQTMELTMAEFKMKKIQRHLICRSHYKKQNVFESKLFAAVENHNKV